jgi:hypothetical protein
VSSLFASGDGMTLLLQRRRYPFYESVDVQGQSPVVAYADLGGNNAENSYGWSGFKFVVYDDGELILLDYAIELWRMTQGGLVLIGEGISPDVVMCNGLEIMGLDLRIDPILPNNVTSIRNATCTKASPTPR